MKIITIDRTAKKDRTAKNRDWAPNLPRLQHPNRQMPELACRWVQSGDARLPVACRWQVKADSEDEFGSGESSIELSRCA